MLLIKWNLSRNIKNINIESFFHRFTYMKYTAFFIHMRWHSNKHIFFPREKSHYHKLFKVSAVLLLLNLFQEHHISSSHSIFCERFFTKYRVNIRNFVKKISVQSIYLNTLYFTRKIFISEKWRRILFLKCIFW